MNLVFLCVFFSLFIALAILCQAATINTIVGTVGIEGYSGDGGPAPRAQLHYPYDVAVSSEGELYIADSRNNRIRKILKNGTIITFAGNGSGGFSGDGGAALEAKLLYPHGVAVSVENEVYIADTGNHRIRKIFLNGTITTIAGNGTKGFLGDGGLATSAQLSSPERVAVSRQEVFFPDKDNNRIRKILLNGTIIAIAGNGDKGYSGDGGPATHAQLYYPNGVAVSSDGHVYIADSYNHRIRKILPSGTIVTIAGSGKNGYRGDGGPAIGARLYSPSGVAISSGGEIFIDDSYNHRIRKVFLNGTIITIAGNGTQGSSGDGGRSTMAQLDLPRSIVLSLEGDLYITESNLHRVRLSTEDATCYGIESPDPGVCSGHGKCVSSNVCICDCGYGASNCSAVMCYGLLSSYPGICSGHGYCVSPNNCSCDSGYGALDCSAELFSCDDILSIDGRVCSGHGSCIALNNCSCDSGYVGDNCSMFSCFGTDSLDPNVCFGNGTCILPNTCSCDSGYAGPKCNETTCFGEGVESDGVCSGHGECRSPNNCSCYVGYDGKDCSRSICYGASGEGVCSGTGTCTSPNNCSCDRGYGGDNCSIVICHDIHSTNLLVCSGHGNCTHPDTCSCHSGYTGANCSGVVCYGKVPTNNEVCSGHGKCTGPNECVCNSGYSRFDCSTFTEHSTKLAKRTAIPLSVFAVCSLTTIVGIIILYMYKQRLKRRKNDELQAKLLEYEFSDIGDNEKPQMLSTIQIRMDELTFSSKISEGAGGTVYKGLWYNRTVAIKRLKVGGDESFIREVSVLNRLRHPNVIALYGYSIDHSDNKYIITEFADNGSLDDALYSNKLKKFESKISALLDIAQGMHYLHSRNPKILHMDIKPQNVLMQKDNTCKLCDFGVSKITDHLLTVGVSLGTLQYMCPELLSQSDYDEKCDVYSFGIMMHEVFTLEKPYMSSDTHSFSLGLQILQGKRPIIPSWVEQDDCDCKLVSDFFFKSNQLKHALSDTDIRQIVIKFFQLCTACWSQDPAQRPCFEDVSKLLRELHESIS